jgi:hypothetical protein
MHFIHANMKCLLRGMLLLLSLIPIVCFAEWEMAPPQSAAPNDPFFQAGTQQNDAFAPSATAGEAFPNQFANLGTPAPVYAISISGSLKQNLERIFGRYHWKVVWKAPYDYNFDGRITGASVPDVLEKLLKPFPLQAVMYMSNRTMVIIPRHKQND